MLYQQSPLHQNIAAEQANRMKSHTNNLEKISHARPPEANLLNAINYNADLSGCGLWRMKWPEFLLNAYSKMSIVSSTTMILDERFYTHMASVRIQRQATPHQKKFVKFLKSLGIRVIYEVDDIIFREDIPDYNQFKHAFASDEIRETSMEIIQMCDEVTVTCEFMKQYYIRKTNHPHVTVIPNLPPRFWLDRWYDRKKLSRDYKKHCTGSNSKPRILYAGSSAHFDLKGNNQGRDDFAHVISDIVKTIDEYQWVFIGGHPPILNDFVKAGKIESHPWLPILKLPEYIYNLNINCMVAPLQDNMFNKAKSDIKVIEASAFGIPIICQDIITYHNAPVKFTTGEDMISKLRYILKSGTRYTKASKDIRGYIEDRWLDDNIDIFTELYSTPYGSELRENIQKYNP